MPDPVPLTPAVLTALLAVAGLTGAMLTAVWMNAKGKMR